MCWSPDGSGPPTRRVGWQGAAGAGEPGAQAAIPVTIGIPVTPGNKSEAYPDNLGMRNPDHRAEEYDASPTAMRAAS